MLDLKCNFPHNFLTFQSFHYSDVYESLFSEHLTKMKDAATALGSRQIGLERNDIIYPKLTHL